MALLDDALGANTSALGATGYSFIDADTLTDTDGNRFRIQGIDAPEVEKITKHGYGLGDAGGAAATDTLRNLANDFGFHNVKPVLDENGEPMVDPFGRALVDLTDENGQSFKSKILESGILGTTRYTQATDRLTSELGQLSREQAQLSGTQTDTEWDQARQKLQAAMEAEGAKSLGFRQTAIDEAQLAAARAVGAGNFYATDNVQVRDYDRTIQNDSLNPFTDSWEQGWIGVKEAAFGITNLLGETTGNEWIADIGEAGVARARTQIADYGDILTDWKDVKNFDTAIQYVSNNLALSLPYMAITAGGAAAGGLGVVAGVAGFAAPSAIYAGQVWNEQEGDNKNAALAIGAGVAQGALDRLGLSFLFKTGGAPKKLLNDAVEELVKKGATREAAEATVAQATRKELAGFVGDAATVARQQIEAKQLFKTLAGRGAVSAGGEAVTEAMQEAIGYTAAHTGNNFETFDFNDLTERALAGAIAGGVLGGAFSVPGTAYDAGAWADVAVRQAPAEAARLSQAGKFAEQEEAAHGRIKTLPELIAETKLAEAGRGVKAETLEDRAAKHRTAQKDLTTGEKIFEVFAAAPSLWRGATRWIFQDNILERSRTARIMADMFGGQLQRTFGGASFENSKFHKVGVYKNMVQDPNQVYAALNDGKIPNARRKAEISREIYDNVRAAIDPETKKIDMSKVDPRYHQLVKDMNALGDRMWQDQKQFNDSLGYLDNYLFRYKSFDKAAIYKNKPKFVAALMKEFNMSEKDANEIATAITESDAVNDFSDALEGHAAQGKPGAHKERTLNLSEKEAFQEFMNQDIYANIANATKSAARYTSYQEYVGDNHSVLNQMLDQMIKEGLSEAEVNKIAKQMLDYLSAESGNYKRPESEFGKSLERIQRNLMVWMTVAGLPLATISSFVESALVTKGLTMDQIFGKNQDGKGGLAKMGHEFGQTLWRGMGEVVSVADRKQRPPAATAGQKIIRDLGYLDWDVGSASISSTATKVGATEISARSQKFLDSYFRATGLQGWTNFTRAARAAIAGDYILDKLETISVAIDNTNEVQEAREALRNLGINVQDAVAAFNQGEALPDDVMREAIFTFVNDAVALPQSANRPLIYQDPRFALFTQFQGFIATFTANHIPKLWGEYVKRGTPAMKYNAFATMTTMIVLGFASQYLKDLIKYGQLREFGPGAHPYLNTSEYLQRGVRSSGLLGTGERVLDQFFPLYEKRSGSVGEWAFNGLTGESPALSFATRGVGGIGKGITGDVGGAAKEAVRLTPLGPFNFIRDAVGNTADSWNFNGE